MVMVVLAIRLVSVAINCDPIGSRSYLGFVLDFVLETEALGKGICGSAAE